MACLDASIVAASGPPKAGSTISSVGDAVERGLAAAIPTIAADLATIALTLEPAAVPLVGMGDDSNTNETSWSFNGLDGSTGNYLTQPLAPRDLVRRVFGEKLDRRFEEQTDERLKQKLKGFADRIGSQHFGLKAGVSPTDLSQAGWGIVFANKNSAVNEAIREALGELIALRKDQCKGFRKDGGRYYEYIGPDAYRSGEGVDKFLARSKMGPGPVDPDRVPYYLLLVGDPEAIPYRFQSELDVQYAVGRIDFDTLDEYASYARSVVAAETGKVRLARKATFFGTANADDAATTSSLGELVSPLADSMDAWLKDEPTLPGWDIRKVLKDDATKARLAALLGAEAPALLFTASHGMGFAPDDARQIPHTGALVCQDWPGPARWRKEIPHDFYFAGEDMSSDTGLLGQLAFFFACYGGGCPLLDPFSPKDFGPAPQVAPFPFVSRLPRRMLGHPKGGALAVVGHVERAWSFSFNWPGAGAQRVPFESTLQKLLVGEPIGAAMEYLNMRYAELSTRLTNNLEDIDNGATLNPFELGNLWLSNNDARNYVIFGDPAVRLCVGDNAQPVIDRAPIPAVGHRATVLPVQHVDASTQPVTSTTSTLAAKPVTSEKPFSTPSEAPADDVASARAALTAELLAIAGSPSGFEVVTWVGPGGAVFDEATGGFTQGAERRFVTKVLVNGSIATCVPEGGGDATVFAQHTTMVEKAIAARRETLAALAAAIAKLGER